MPPAQLLPTIGRRYIVDLEQSTRRLAAALCEHQGRNGALVASCTALRAPLLTPPVLSLFRTATTGGKHQTSCGFLHYPPVGWDLGVYARAVLVRTLAENDEDFDSLLSTPCNMPAAVRRR